MADAVRCIRSLAAALAVGVAISAPAQAAGWLEKNFYLSGQNYDGVLPPCEAALGRIAARFGEKESRFWNSDLQILDFERVREIRIARGAALLAMRLHRVDIGAVEQGLVGAGIVGADALDQFILAKEFARLGPALEHRGGGGGGPGGSRRRQWCSPQHPSDLQKRADLRFDGANRRSLERRRRSAEQRRRQVRRAGGRRTQGPTSCPRTGSRHAVGPSNASPSKYDDPHLVGR